MLLVTACACCVLTGIAIGTFVATMARSVTQAQLMLFFVNPPLMALFGGFTPIEAMPKWIQPFTYLTPRGTLKMTIGNTATITWPFKGISPAMPA